MARPLFKRISEWWRKRTQTYPEWNETNYFAGRQFRTRAEMRAAKKTRAAAKPRPKTVYLAGYKRPSWLKRLFAPSSERLWREQLRGRYAAGMERIRTQKTETQRGAALAQEPFEEAAKQALEGRKQLMHVLSDLSSRGELLRLERRVLQPGTVYSKTVYAIEHRQHGIPGTQVLEIDPTQEPLVARQLQKMLRTRKFLNAKELRRALGESEKREYRRLVEKGKSELAFAQG